ncbi:phospholipase [Antarcticibacterium flavum]|uniref:Phospholipase n=1 Tax=Antarcticibacterium flavum TaxID=2058175 RepID=A0A5B7WZW4_9FLAO|nr:MULTISPECIES: prolyl oligopeptidase family serine peptidase [Antarcticibacterium]MCM4159873.1 phospholipase [Antarcticibacterium sp. W02-3]QCY68874.1 phospholipase [Antarcticibacterium flavum]
MKSRLLWLLAIILLVLLMIPVSMHAQTGFHAYEKEVFIEDNDSLHYRILYPPNFDRTKKNPLILFLHGAGERGDNNESQLINGGDLFLKKQDEFPAVVIFPQAPKEDYWAKVEVNRDTLPFQFDFKNEEEPTKALHLVMALLTSVTAEDYIDTRKVYVGGLSMGGMGTFEIISRQPETFAAAFAICGGADPAIAQKYPEGFNIWIFHGEKDDVVIPEYSKTMAREINSHGGNAKLSLYPNDNHNSWDSAFAEPYLLKWLFSHERMD